MRFRSSTWRRALASGSAAALREPFPTDLPLDLMGNFSCTDQ
jgi:hypothetical protein